MIPKQLSEIVQQVTDEILVMVRADALHQLTPQQRNSVYASFGARNDPFVKAMRGWLAITSGMGRGPRYYAGTFAMTGCGPRGGGVIERR